jgi:hypothetical protein
MIDRAVDRLVVSALLKRVTEAKAAIMAAVQAIDPKSLNAAAASRETERADRNRRKREADRALAASVEAAGEKASPARKKSVPKWRRGRK